MARTSQTDRPIPAVGERIWYRLRINGELVPATVIDAWTDDHDDTTRLRRPKHGLLHLEVELDPERHHAASERALRLEVEEGDAAGQWSREKPAGEDERFEKAEERRLLMAELNRERAQGGKKTT